MAVGKRTFGGLIDDGVKSGMRYILNNFFDGHKQDALDLLTGTYTIKKGVLLSGVTAVQLMASSAHVLDVMCPCPLSTLANPCTCCSIPTLNASRCALAWHGALMALELLQMDPRPSSHL